MFKPSPDDDIIGFTTSHFDRHSNPGRRILERVWYRNILYYLGEQWIEFLQSSDLFQRRYKHNPYEPTPVDNIIREFCRSMVSLIIGKEHAVTVWPNSDTVKDKNAAEIGKQFLEHMENENGGDLQDEIELASLFITIIGTTFIRTFPEMLESFRAKPFTKDGVVSGKNNIIVTNEHLSAFCVFPDEQAIKPERARYMGIQTLKPVDWVNDVFNVKVTADADSTGINYQRRLMKLVGSVSQWKGAGIEQMVFDTPDDEMCIFREIEFSPRKAYPDGRYVVVAGNQVVFDMNGMPIPKSEDGRWEYTLTRFLYYLVPGRFWGEGGVTDLISPQNTINEIDQALIKNRKGIGRPIVITTPDMNIKRVNDPSGSFTLIEYDPLLSGGQRPDINRGIALPAQVFEERKATKESSQEMAGDPKHVLRGKAPSSQASGVMVDILKEAAESSHTPDIKRFYRSKAKVYRKSLMLSQHVYSDEMFIKIAGDGQNVKVRSFKGADLHNNFDVKLELSGGLSTTNAGRTEAMFKIAEGGWFGDLQQDPETRQEFLRRIGLGGFKHKLNVDIERALKENSMISTAKKEDIKKAQVFIDKEMKRTRTIFFIDGIFISCTNFKRHPDDPRMVLPVQEVISPDPYFKYDNHQIHFEIIRRFILSDEFQVLPFPQQQIAIAHADLHHLILKSQEMQEMKMRMAMQGAGQESADGGSRQPSAAPQAMPPRPVRPPTGRGPAGKVTQKEAQAAQIRQFAKR